MPLSNLMSHLRAAKPDEKATMSLGLQERLETARAAIPKLEHRKHELLLDRENAGPDDDTEELETELDQVRAALVDAKQEIADITGMLAVQAERETAKDAEAARKIRASQVASVLQHLASRDKAARNLEVSLADVVTHFKSLVHHSEAVRDAWPRSDGSAPTGIYSSYGELKTLVAEEFYRQGGLIDGKANYDLPGARLADIRFQFQPDKIARLSETLAQATAFVRKKLSGNG